ncbi:hypothetical protein [Sphingomonas jinjuensis]|uniref:Mom family adenine methylcarbamoylation protein n=1 Tax=Sphingomonas jinjuensis TaxID=535907 RepID=UPI00161111BC
MENLLSVGLPALDFARPRGAAGEGIGYLFAHSEGDAIGFGDEAFAVALLDRQIANGIIIANHYSRRVYRASTLHLGVWIDRRLVGVLQYGFAMNPASAGSVVTGTAMNEYLELNRMWLDDAAPRNSESKALAYSIRLIRRVRPAVKWIQSFADERCGLFGTVYQAAGFTFHGEHQGRFWELDGEWYHDSLMSNSRTASSPRASHLRSNRNRAVAHRLRQFRYLRFLKPRFARGCRYPALPFPKPAYEQPPA